MTPKLEIQKTLVLSTNHLPKWMADAMDAIDANRLYVTPEGREEAMDDVSFDVVEYGYRVHVSEDPEIWDPQPVEIRAAMKLANANGCTWIMFDRDGFIYDTLLPVYDWED